MSTMNRLKVIIQAFAALVLLLILPAGCRENRTYRIGISQCSQDDWRNKANDEVMREIMLHEDATVEIRSADDSNAKQIEDIRYFADNGFDIIIAAPNEAGAITPVIKEVYQKGIPVVIFDRDINGDSYTARITADNQAIGREAGKYALTLTKKLPHAPRALELYGLQGSSPAKGRHAGFADAFNAGGGEIVGTGYGHWNQEDAVRATDSLLNLYPDVDVIYAHNDRMAIGASEVAGRRGLRDRIKIIGIDAAPAIGIQAVADSVIDATFLYPTEGHLLVKTAIAILKGKPYDKEIILPASSPVDLTNADILLLQDKSLQQETEKMKELKTRIDEYWQEHSAQTSLFYASIAILVLVFLSLFLTLRAFWQRKRHQQVLMRQNALLEAQGEEQKKLNEQLESALKSKLAFYTNVSHDLRTPLTLIAEPVAQLASAPNLTARQHTLAQLAEKNVKILRRLINQILDFRKYENGKMTLNLQETDFTGAVREWMASFTEVARKRDIRLNLSEPEGPVSLAVDPEKMERVFFNLISNAIKYTPDNGTINVDYRIDGDRLVIDIADNGIGIAATDLQSIFDQFYQVEKENPQGSGIGLSLVKAFVELHGGTITVESQVGKGSVFTVVLPVTHTSGAAVTPQKLITDEEVTAELRRVDAAEEPHRPEEPAADAEDAETAPAADDGGGEPHLPRLLIIDDNADIRMLVSELLGDSYEIHQASNGKEGLAKAVKLIPDLIVCDIMMPVMDGLECCRHIKEEVSTSHIPVLMLTACALDRQRVEGYESGADAYLSKPFSGELLASRCRNLIANRKRIRDLWQGGQLPLPAAVPSKKADKAAGEAQAPAREEAPAPRPLAPGATVGNVDLDNEFYARFLTIFSGEISNPNLNIELMASKMGLGHSQFYRKIKALTNYTPVELIRQLRLKQGRHLLQTTDKSVSEIAYEVGFSSPAYFTKCYRNTFGETPSDLRDKISPA